MGTEQDGPPGTRSPHGWAGETFSVPALSEEARATRNGLPVGWGGAYLVSALTPAAHAGSAGQPWEQPSAPFAPGYGTPHPWANPQVSHGI